MKHFFLLCHSALCFLSGIGQQAAFTFVPASDRNIQYTGRFDFSDKSRPAFMYSGSSIRIAFTGTSVAVVLEDDSLRNWFTVKLDDSLFTFVASRKDGLYELATELPNQKHSLEISRRTEWHGGISRLKGFKIDSGQKLLPVRRLARSIEFIGDSYTCGYGNEGKSKEDHFSYETENNYASYGAVTARALGANYIGICRSGIGMYQSYGGDKTFTQPRLYDEVLTNKKVKWDYAHNQPQVVLIELGANDFSKDLDSAAYVDTYIGFLKKIRLLYPMAKIICAAGPSSANDPQWLQFQSYVKTAAGYYRKTDKKIYYFKFSTFDPHGSDYHPNIQEHKMMAAELIPFIKKITNW